MAKKNKSKYKKIRRLLNFILKGVVLILIIILLHAIYKGLNQDGYIVQSLQVPKSFVDNGYNGYVVANRIQDEIIKIKASARSSRNDSMQVVANSNNDLRMDVMGIGVSSKSLTYHLKDLLGIETKTIGGDLTQLGNMLNLTLRIDGFPTKHITEPYDPNEPNIGFENIIKNASEHVLSCIDPYYLALKRIREEKYQEAKSILRDIITNHPEDEKWAYLAWGTMKKKLQEKEAAIEFYNQSLEVDPTFVNANQSLAWIYFTDRDYDAAIPYFKKCLKKEDKNFGANNGIAMSYVELGDFDKAEFHYKRNLKNFPDMIWAYGNYGGYLLNHKKDTLGFINLYKEAGQSIKQKDEYFVSMSTVAFMEQDNKASLEYLEKALDFNPDNVGALQIKANYLSRFKKDYEGAENCYRRLIAVYKKKDYDVFMKMSAYNSIAIAEHYQGKLDSALIHAQLAVKTLPDAAIPYTTLAEVYYLKNQKSEFYETYKIAFDKNLEFMDHWWDDEPYTKLKNDKRFLAMIQESKLRD